MTCVLPRCFVDAAVMRLARKRLYVLPPLIHRSRVIDPLSLCRIWTICCTLSLWAAGPRGWSARPSCTTSSTTRSGSSSRSWPTSMWRHGRDECNAPARGERNGKKWQECFLLAAFANPHTASCNNLCLLQALSMLTYPKCAMARRGVGGKLADRMCKLSHRIVRPSLPAASSTCSQIQRHSCPLLSICAPP